MTPTPRRTGGEGRLVAASAAFFTHQGHEVFWDPCPDLTAYRRAGRITSTIFDMNRLPDHILAAGLDLLNSLPPSSAGGILGISFMAEYLPASPLAVAPQGNSVSLSHPRHGGSGGSICRFFIPSFFFQPLLLLCLSRGVLPRSYMLCHPVGGRHCSPSDSGSVAAQGHPYH